VYRIPVRLAAIGDLMDCRKRDIGGAPRLEGIPATGVFSLFLLLAPFASAGEGQSSQEVSRRIGDLMSSGRCDLSVFGTIRALPKDERLPLAKQLISSAHPAMRHHAMLLLQGFPPEVTGGTIRSRQFGKRPGHSQHHRQSVSSQEGGDRND